MPASFRVARSAASTSAGLEATIGASDEVTAIYLDSDDGSDPLVMDMLGVKASQARGITDPLAGVQQVHSDESRIKLLAERYLAREAGA